MYKIKRRGLGPKIDPYNITYIQTRNFSQQTSLYIYLACLFVWVSDCFGVYIFESIMGVKMDAGYCLCCTCLMYYDQYYRCDTQRQMYKIDKEGGGAKIFLQKYIQFLSQIFGPNACTKFCFTKRKIYPVFWLWPPIKANAQIAQPIHSLTIAVLKIQK